MLSPETSSLYPDIEKLLLTSEAISARVDELAKTLTRDYAGRDLVCVCILKGACHERHS